MILSIDAGNHEVKVCGKFGLLKFLSDIGEGRDINLKQIHGEDDMIFEYEGRRGFAGSLAKYESEFSGAIMGDTKVNSDTKIRVLLAIHRYCTKHDINANTFQIVVGQPIRKHTPEEKGKLKVLLTGKHTITVNNVTRSFIIQSVEVAAEGVSAFWSNPIEGLVRIIDLGGGTCNYSSVLNGRIIDKDSDTLLFGMSTNKSQDISALARGIATETLKKWDKNDNIFIVGGAAEILLPHIKQFYPNSNILYPIYNQKLHNPIYANVIAFYNIGVNIYE